MDLYALHLFVPCILLYFCVFVVDGKPVLNPERVFEHLAAILAEYPHVLASEYAHLITNYFLTPSLWRHWTTADLRTLSCKYSQP